MAERLNAEHLRNLGRIPEMYITPAQFVNGLAKVPRAELSDNEYDRRCAICHEELGIDDHGNGEEAVKLPCGHIFGQECLLSFLNVETQTHNQWGYLSCCPLCRQNLPQMARWASNMTDNATFFLLWIARNDRVRGAALDRHYAAAQGIAQARDRMYSFPNMCNHIYGGLSTLDYLYFHDLECMAHLNPDDPYSWGKVEEIHDKIDQHLKQYLVHPNRSQPVAPWFGRKPRITTIEAIDMDNDQMLADLEEGEIYQAQGHVWRLDIPLEATKIDIASWPDWISEAFSQDFAHIGKLAGIYEDQVLWEELRARRFARAIISKKVDKDLLMRMAAEQAGDKALLDAYGRDNAFRSTPPRFEWHWELNDSSNTLEYGPDYY